MTITPVISVTDKLVTELEALYLAGWEASGEGWNAEYPGDAHETKGFADLMHKSCGPIIAKLLAERAELLRDARRYRWLRDQNAKSPEDCSEVNDFAVVIDGPDGGVWVRSDLDAAIDAAMQSEAKP